MDVNDGVERFVAYGKQIVMIPLPKRTPNRQVELRMMPGDKITRVQPVTVVELFGEPGTINVNSWSPDSKRFAFVSYEGIPDQPAK